MLDSAQVQGALRKAVAAVIGFLLTMVLLTALLLTGFYLLVRAAVLSLSPWLGEVGALWLVGFICVLLLALFFWRLVRRPKASAKQHKAPGESGIDALRDLIRKNPWEAVLMAFAVGIAEQGDARLKSLLLQAGTILMRNAEARAANPPANDETPGPDDQVPPGADNTGPDKKVPPGEEDVP